MNKLNTFYWIIILFFLAIRMNPSYAIESAFQTIDTSKQIVRYNSTAIKVNTDSVEILSIKKKNLFIKIFQSNNPQIFKTDANAIKAGNPTLIELTTVTSTVLFRNPENKSIAYKPEVRLAGSAKKVLVKDPSFRDRDPLNFRTFSKKQGMRNGFVLSLFQDNCGNIWMATYGSITKYNGKSFTFYTHDEGFPGQPVRSMFQDEHGDIWFASYGNGVCRFDGNYLYTLTESEGLPNNKARCMVQSNNKVIWIGSDNGLTEITGNRMFNYSKSNGIPNISVCAMIEDSRGNLWIGMHNGDIATIHGDSITRYSTPDGLLKSPIRSIFEDRSGKIWFTTSGNGVFYFEHNRLYGYSTKQGLSSNTVWAVTDDNNGDLWFATEEYICKFNGETFTWFTEREGLPLNTIKSVLKDKLGNLWFGTYGAGVSVYGGNLFTHLTEKEGLPSPIIRAILMDKDKNIWFGSYNGLICYNGSNYIKYSTSQGLSDNNIRSLYQDKNGDIWIGTNNGLNRFDGLRFYQYSSPSGQFAIAFLSIEEDKDGNIWFGTWGKGVFKYNGSDFWLFNQKLGLPNNFVWALHKESKGNLWIGTEGGACQFDGNSFMYFNTTNGLSNENVWSITEDKFQNLWFGTLNGVTILTKGESELSGAKILFNDRTVYTLSDKTGLPGVDAVDIYSDFEGNIFIGTSSGLGYIPSEKLQQIDSLIYNIKQLKRSEIKSFTYDDGFLGIGVYEGKSICQGTGGDIWIGSGDRLTTLHKDAMNMVLIPPCLQLTGIDLFNETIDWISLIGKDPAAIDSNIQNSAKDTTFVLSNGVQVSDLHFSGLSPWNNLPVDLKLNYLNNFITFDFLGIALQKTNKVTYQYRLDGFDETWSSPSIKTSATYGNLPHGNFTFRVKAMNDDGIWSNELTYNFTITPPWWKTIAAKIFFTSFIISLLIVIYYWRINSLQKQKKHLEEVVKEKTAEIIDQNEELITLNTEQRTLNEELTALNEELYNQREEMEITLETLKKAQDQLVQSEKMASLGILAAGITHEINNPLNFIACGTFIIEQFFEDNYPERMEELRPMLESIKLGIKRSTDIVTSLNQFSRQGESNNESCNLHAIIDNCLTILQNELKMRIEIVKYYMDEPCILIGNEGKLHQVFINILSNASQAIEGKGKIRIDTYKSDDFLKVEIADSGHGISKENITKINDPFFTTKEAGKGVGLGLSIVYSIIAEHKGTIEYESEVGVGTKVIIGLPLKQS